MSPPACSPAPAPVNARNRDSGSERRLLRIVTGRLAPGLFHSLAIPFSSLIDEDVSPTNLVRAARGLNLRIEIPPHAVLDL